MGVKEADLFGTYENGCSHSLARSESLTHTPRSLVRQGGFESELLAARSHDIMALKCKGYVYYLDNLLSCSPAHLFAYSLIRLSFGPHVCPEAHSRFALARSSASTGAPSTSKKAITRRSSRFYIVWRRRISSTASASSPKSLATQAIALPVGLRCNRTARTHPCTLSTTSTPRERTPSSRR